MVYNVCIRATILCFVDHGVDVVLEEALVFFLIDFYPSFLIHMILVCQCRKGGMSAALEIADRDKRSAGLIW